MWTHDRVTRPHCAILIWEAEVWDGLADLRTKGRHVDFGSGFLHLCRTDGEQGRERARQRSPFQTGDVITCRSFSG